MFIGSMGARGLHWLAQHVTGPAITETVARGGGEVTVTLHADGSLSAQDHGAPPSTEPNPSTGLPRFAATLTEMETDPKQSALYGRPFTYPLGLEWFGQLEGLAPLNALAERLEAEVRSGGVAHRVHFERGMLVNYRQEPAKEPIAGLSIRFLPDWPLLECDPRALAGLQEYLRKLAYLVPEVRLNFVDELRGTRQELYEPEGVLALIGTFGGFSHQAQPCCFRSHGGSGEVELAFHFETRVAGQVRYYANSRRANEDSEFAKIFRSTLTRLIREAAAMLPPITEQPLPTFRALHGLKAVVALRLQNAHWTGATREHLANEEAAGLVRQALETGWEEWLSGDAAAAARMAHDARWQAWARDR